MSSASQPISDSPWFWAYVFATGAVVALLLGTTRLNGRQEQIERQFLARQRAGQVIGPAPTTASSRQAEGASALQAGVDADIDAELPEHETIISHAPLQILMTIVLCLAWAAFLYQRRYGAAAGPNSLESPSPGQHETQQL